MKREHLYLRFRKRFSRRLTRLADKKIRSRLLRYDRLQKLRGKDWERKHHAAAVRLVSRYYQLSGEPSITVYKASLVFGIPRNILPGDQDRNRVGAYGDYMPIR